MDFGVTTLATVTRDGDQWVTRRYDIQGSLTVPSAAAREIKDGSVCFRWTETPHAVDAHCPVCMSAAVCVQEVTLYPDSGGVLVVHEATSPRMN